MDKYVKFDIENIDFAQDDNANSQFATARIHAFSSDINRHDLTCSEDVLKNTAPTIYNKPILYSLDERLDDFYTHTDPDKSLICGFVVPDSAEFVRLPDKRLGLFVTAKIWKRYAPKVMSLFKRDKAKKKVSVEMEVNKLQPLNNALTDMVDFVYSGICILGDFITEASPGAEIKMLSFSQENNEYKKAVKKEFSYVGVDFKIPQEVKDNVSKGLLLRKQYGMGGTSLGVSFAQNLIKDSQITPELVKAMHEYFSSHKTTILNQSELPLAESIDNLIWGGTEAKVWIEDVFSKIEKEEAQMAETITFPYKTRKDMNPALRGIDPPITPAQASAIAKQADAIGNDEKKNGWAIAISAFKKSHVAKDGKWVKKEKLAMEEFTDEEKLCVDKMQEDEKQDTYLGVESVRKEEENMNDEVTKKEEMQEEVMEQEVMQEKPVEEEEEEEGKEEEMAKPAPEKTPSQDEVDGKDKEQGKPKDVSDEVKMALNVPSILDFMKTEAPLYRAMKDSYGERILEIFEALASEISKGKFAVTKDITELMMAYMREVSAKVSALTKEFENVKKNLTTEVSALTDYKKGVEQEKFAFEVDKVLAEAFEAGMPKEDIEVLRADSKEFSLNTVDTYKNMVKAKAFVFVNLHAHDTKQEEQFIKIGLPFTDEKPKQENIWE